MLPGVHRIQKTHRDGRITEYWYARRGGPQILKAGPASRLELPRLVSRAVADATLRYNELVSAPEDKATLFGLITRYLAPTKAEPDKPPTHLRSLSPRTLNDRRKHLDKVREQLGRMEIAALRSPRARKVLLDWRNQSAATPKPADDRLYALSCVLEWARDNGDLSTNPVANFPRIYSVDRAEIIWEPHHLELLYRHADAAFADFVRVSVLSGIRLGDLRSLVRSAVKSEAIIFQTGKSRGKRTAVVPIYPALREALDAITPSRKSTTLLNSSRGTPWSEAGLESALRRARISALKEAKEQSGESATSGLEELRIHDMRGTAATNFMRWGVKDEELATIMGWKIERVREIRRRYVSDQVIGEALVQRISENKRRAESVNRAVNRPAT